MADKQDYSAKTPIHGVEVQAFREFFMEDGSFAEVARFNNIPNLQVNISTLEGHRIKAWHLHKKQVDYWYPLDKLMIGLHDIREDSPTKGQTMRFPLRRALLKIPIGVLHAVWNPSFETRTLLYCVDNFFDGTDELREPWNFLGAEFFNPVHG